MHNWCATRDDALRTHEAEALFPAARPAVHPRRMRLRGRVRVPCDGGRHHGGDVHGHLFGEVPRVHRCVAAGWVYQSHAHNSVEDTAARA